MHPSNPIIQPQVKQISSESSVDMHVALERIQEEEMRENLY